VLTEAPENALVESENTLQSSRRGWEHLEVLRITGEGYQSVWEVCVWLPDGFTFCWCGDDGCCHSLSLSIENIAMCVWTVITLNCNCENTRGWVMMKWSRDLCMAVIGVAIVQAYNCWSLINCHMTTSTSDLSWPWIVLGKGPGNPPAVRIWLGKTGRFRSRTIQKPDPLLLGGPNLDPYLLTCGFCWVWRDPSVPISSAAFRVFYSWSHSDILMLIPKDRCLYIVVIFQLIGSL